MPMDPQAYCHDVCKKSGSNFLYTLPFLQQKDQRRALEAFYAFCASVDASVDEAKDKTTARAELSFWRMEVDRMYVSTPQHPIGLALTPYLRRYAIPQQYLMDIVNGCEMDLEKNEYATFAELELYCYRVASCVGLVCIRIFGIEPTKHHEEIAIAFGKALQLTNILRDVVEDLDRQRIYLPQEDFHHFHVSIEDFQQRRNSKAICMLLSHEMKRARHFFRLAFENIPDDKMERGKWFPAMLMARAYEGILHTLEKNPTIIYQRKVRLSTWRKGIIILRTWIENFKGF